MIALATDQCYSKTMNATKAPAENHKHVLKSQPLDEQGTRFAWWCDADGCLYYDFDDED